MGGFPRPSPLSLLDVALVQRAEVAYRRTVVSAAESVSHQSHLEPQFVIGEHGAAEFAVRAEYLRGPLASRVD